MKNWQDNGLCNKKFIESFILRIISKYVYSMAIILVVIETDPRYEIVIDWNFMPVEFVK